VQIKHTIVELRKLVHKIFFFLLIKFEISKKYVIII